MATHLRRQKHQDHTGITEATLKAKDAWNELYQYPKQITVSHDCYIQQNYLLELMEK